MSRRLALALLLLATAVAAHGERTPGASAQLSTAQAAREAGDLRTVEAALRGADALAPNDPEILRLLGTVQVQRNDAGEGLRTLQRALRLAPADQDIRLAIAQAYFVIGDSARTARIVAEVLAADPGNSDARDLADRVARVRRDSVDGGKWQMNAAVSYSDFGDGARNPWHDVSLGLDHHLDGQTLLLTRVDIADRFNRTDLFAEAGIERSLGRNVSASLYAGATPDADFLAKYAVRGGLRARALHNRGGDLVVTLDGRHADYWSGSVETLSPGFEQYLAGGTLWLTGRLIVAWDERNRRQTGYLLRTDAEVGRGLRLFAGYADAPETSENVTLSTRSFFGGAVIELGHGLALQLDYTRDNRQQAYVRNAFSIGLRRPF